MSFDLEKVLESKRALRRHLAARPVAEKLRMLDALRERALTLRASSDPASVDTDAQTVFTIGHSNLEFARFVALLKQHDIQAVADVRSSPYSQYNPQFNRE